MRSFAHEVSATVLRRRYTQAAYRDHQLCFRGSTSAPTAALAPGKSVLTAVGQVAPIPGLRIRKAFCPKFERRRYSFREVIRRSPFVVPRVGATGKWKLLDLPVSRQLGFLGIRRTPYGAQNGTVQANSDQDADPHEESAARFDFIVRLVAPHGSRCRP